MTTPTLIELCAESAAILRNGRAPQPSTCAQAANRLNAAAAELARLQAKYDEAMHAVMAASVEHDALRAECERLREALSEARDKMNDGQYTVAFHILCEALARSPAQSDSTDSAKS